MPETILYVFEAQREAHSSLSQDWSQGASALPERGVYMSVLSRVYSIQLCNSSRERMFACYQRRDQL
jgi:hypothetical protein